MAVGALPANACAVSRQQRTVLSITSVSSLCCSQPQTQELALSMASPTALCIRTKAGIVTVDPRDGAEDQDVLGDQNDSKSHVVRLDVLMHSPRAHLLATRPALTSHLAQLSSQLTRMFTTAKKELQAITPGACIDVHQPADSFQRLDSQVRQAITAYIRSGAEDWRKYVSFNQHHYVRHLIDSNDDYELMLLCWAPGQVSRVHNHATSHCWLSCVSGEVEENQYALIEDDPHTPHMALQPNVPGVLKSMQPCPPLQLSTSHRVQVGGIGYINDSLCLHSVGCPSGIPAPGSVTLHLYAPPIRRVQLYEPDENRVTTRVPGFFSIRGQQV